MEPTQLFNAIWDVKTEGELYSGIKKFIDITGDVNYQESVFSSGRSLLFFACRWRSIRAIHFLIDNGIDINLNCFGKTALHSIIDDYGAMESKYDVIALLLDGKPDLSISWEYGEYKPCVFLWALIYGDMKIVSMLNKYDHWECFGAEALRSRFLVNACYNRFDIAVFDHCVDHYPAAVCEVEGNCTPLHNVLANVYKTERILRKRMTNINHQEADGRTALHRSVSAELSWHFDDMQEMSVRNSQLLIAHGADKYLKDESGQTVYDSIFNVTNGAFAEEWYGFLK